MAIDRTIFWIVYVAPLTVLTTRLELIASTAETVSLELHNVEQFATVFRRASSVQLASSAQR